jgi:hypothetical protein
MRSLLVRVLDRDSQRLHSLLLVRVSRTRHLFLRGKSMWWNSMGPMTLYIP